MKIIDEKNIMLEKVLFVLELSLLSIYSSLLSQETVLDGRQLRLRYCTYTDVYDKRTLFPRSQLDQFYF